MDEPKLSNFKINGPVLQNGENREIKMQLNHTSMIDISN